MEKLKVPSVDTNVEAEESLIRKMLRAWEHRSAPIGDLELSKILTKCNKRELLTEEDLKNLGGHLDYYRRDCTPQRNHYRWAYREALRRLGRIATPSAMWVLQEDPMSPSPRQEMRGPAFTQSDAQEELERYFPKMILRPVTVEGGGDPVAVDPEPKYARITLGTEGPRLLSHDEEWALMKKLVEGEPLDRMQAEHLGIHINLLTAHFELVRAELGHWARAWLDIRDDVKKLEENDPAKDEQDEWDWFPPRYVVERTLCSFRGYAGLEGLFESRAEAEKRAEEEEGSRVWKVN